VARDGMVVSTDSLASAAGLEILRAGGNAVDAAVATQFALAVVNPEAGNIGGGGFLVARMADGTTAALDFREEAPGAATREMFLDSLGNVTGATWTGHLASGVPGSVAGMAEAHQRFGSLPWADLVEPAIRLARDGFTIREKHQRSIARKADTLGWFPASAEVFLPGGEVPEPGTLFRQPDLARTLRAIADSGAKVFYRGWIADSLAAEMERGGGFVSKEDLAAYRAVWREPLDVEYRGYRIISMPPPSSGGVTLGQILNIVESFDLEGLGWHSPDAIHVAVEAMRRAYADRNYYLGDPDFVEMPVERILSQTYADSLAASIDPSRASDSREFSRVPVEPTQTTHISVVDSEGNAVAVTTTLNGWFGSKVVVRGAGFLLNNEMDDFTAKPGVPNQYGLVQGEANAIEPGKRMLSAMAPTIVLNPEGKTELVTGTPGGSTIITTIFQIVTNHIDFGLPVRASVDAPRFHHQNLPDTLRYEKGGLDRATVAELERRGHAVAERKDRSGNQGVSGDVQSIHIGPDGTLYGAADRRRDGRALGY
jgi:gamma-glutamyltranspeptidase/glutathione hydrolase